MAEERESNAGELKVKIDVDCADALKGLKAVTRAAKKATDALKELDEVQRKVSSISITVDGKAIGGILTEHSDVIKNGIARLDNRNGR
jgi:hypothetical protein